MILSFSKHFPWRDKKRQLIPTNFKLKLWQKNKIHTFRLGKRWKAGQKIHAYENNPRNGGQKFGITERHGEDKCYKVENWTMGIHRQAAGVMIVLHIEEVFMFNVTLQHDLSLKYYGHNSEINLEIIAKNDGLTPVEFMRWFEWSSREKGGRVTLEGQVVHLIPNFAYVADLNAIITDAKPAAKNSIREEETICPECMQRTYPDELATFGGLCEPCTNF